MKSVIAVIGKLPKKGFSKTRLAKDIGVDAALELYQAFMHDFFSGLAKNNHRKVYFFGTPANAETHNYFEELFREVGLVNYEIGFQVELPFFERLSSLFGEIHKAEGDCFVHLTGTDIPHFPTEVFDIAENYSGISIGPDPDGGYYYIGSDSKNSEIFSIEVQDGTSNVLELTEKRLQKLKHNYQLLGPCSDIDTLTDLQKIIEQTSSDKIPATARVFKQINT